MASGKMTSWKIKEEKVETATDFIFWVQKSLWMLTANIKLKDACLLLGRKVMKYLDNIVKSKEITLPTKVCLVKAVVFPVIMYGCESWTIKKAEHQKLMLLNCGVGEDS